MLTIFFLNFLREAKRKQKQRKWTKLLCSSRPSNYFGVKNQKFLYIRIMGNSFRIQRYHGGIWAQNMPFPIRKLIVFFWFRLKLIQKMTTRNYFGRIGNYSAYFSRPSQSFLFYSGWPVGGWWMCGKIRPDLRTQYMIKTKKIINF